MAIQKAAPKEKKVEAPKQEKGLVSGLAAFRARQEALTQQRIKNSSKKKSGNKKSFWFKIADGQKMKGWFMQELDPESPNYNDRAGNGRFAVEHKDPDDWSRRALCTTDDPENVVPGECWPCDQGWPARLSLYINFLEDGTDNVWLINQADGSNSIVDSLVEYAGIAGSITNVPFVISRKGSGFNNTKYTLTVAGVPGEPLDPTGYDIIDFSKFLRHVPYDEQEAFFKKDSKEESASGPTDEVPFA
jgi:hypothetical protein